MYWCPSKISSEAWTFNFAYLSTGHYNYVTKDGWIRSYLSQKASASQPVSATLLYTLEYRGVPAAEQYWILLRSSRWQLYSRAESEAFKCLWWCDSVKSVKCSSSSSRKEQQQQQQQRYLAIRYGFWAPGSGPRISCMSLVMIGEFLLFQFPPSVLCTKRLLAHCSAMQYSHLVTRLDSLGICNVASQEEGGGASTVSHKNGW